MERVEPAVFNFLCSGLKKLKNARLRKKAILLLMAITLLNCSSQINPVLYYSNVNAAEHFVLLKEFKKADSCLQIAFNSNQKSSYNQDFLLGAINAMLMDDTVKLVYYLERFAFFGGDVSMLKNKFSQNKILELYGQALNEVVFQKSNSHLRFTLTSLYKAASKRVNKTLVKKIKWYSFLDQKIARGFAVTILPDKMEKRIVDKIDKRNFEKVYRLCTIYGWLGFDLLGEDRKFGKYKLENMDVLLRHFSPEQLDRLEPFVINSIKNFHYYPYLWASAKDYCAIKNPKLSVNTNYFEMNQIYGTLTQAVNGKIIIIPFGSVAELKNKRNELFLNSIEDYCWIRGIDSFPLEERILIPNKN